ncbi:MAG: class I SAM-dependent methyltransferase [Snowella sp.]
MSEKSHRLQQIILAKIQANSDKRITFAEFMALALYHPDDGYYSSGQVAIGAEGDFFTASSLGADFGELLAEQLAEMWGILDYPKPFQVIEMGAGLGDLAIDILNYWQSNYPDLLQNVEYSIIEESPSLIVTQQEKLQSWREKGIGLSWKNWLDLANHSVTGVFFSNELIDAFPVHQVIWQDDRLQEIYVGENQGELIEIIAEISTPELVNYFEKVQIKINESDYPDGYRTEVNLQVLDWLNRIAQKLQQGYLLTIDYGYSAQKYYHPQRCQGTLQCYYQHRYHSDPFVNLGLQDITTHVNFTALENHGQSMGLETLGFTQQGLFLMSLGLGDRLTELSTGKFNFAEIFKRRDALHQLIDPTGLGKFGVLLQGKGLSITQKRRSLKGFNPER